jgi:hypothetical protein
MVQQLIGLFFKVFLQIDERWVALLSQQDRKYHCKNKQKCIFWGQNYTKLLENGLNRI